MDRLTMSEYADQLLKKYPNILSRKSSDVHQTLERMKESTPFPRVPSNKHTYQRNDSNVVFVNFKRLRKD